MSYCIGDLVTSRDASKIGVVVGRTKLNADACQATEHWKTVNLFRDDVYYVLINEQVVKVLGRNIISVRA